MKFTTIEDKPKGARGGGRPENKEWAELAEALAQFKPGTWNKVEGISGVEANRIGAHLRQASSFTEGKALAPFKGRVKVAMTNARQEGGKPAVDLAILVLATPVATPKKTEGKAPAAKRTAKATASK